MSEQLGEDPVIIEATVSVRYAASFVVGRRSVINDPRRSHTAFRFAVWGPKVTANGWEPMDQPEKSAYLPRRFSVLDRVPLGSGPYVLLRLKGVAAPEAGKWERSLQTSLGWLGLNGEEIAVCLDALAQTPA